MTRVLSPDGAKGLTGSSDKTARLWNLETGEPIGPPMLHPAPVLSVCFSNDGRFVLTACNASDGEARLWDAATALPLGPPSRHDHALSAAVFDDDGRTFLTLSDDGAARRWPMPQPIVGDVDLVKLWTQVVTGQTLDAGNAVSVLDAAAWRERRARVMDSDLRSNLEAGSDDVLAWHDNRVGACEISGDGTASHWHLDRLVAARPTDWSLHARRAGVLHRYARDAEAVKELDRGRELGGLDPVRGWCAERALNLERLHRHTEPLWFHQWILAADPKNPGSHNAIGHCKARLGRFDEASGHFRQAATLVPSNIAFQRDLAMSRLALEDRPGYRKACVRLIELVEATGDRDSAQLAALTCVLDAYAVPNWDAVVRLAARAAEGYDGDYRVHVAALWRAGRIAEALQRPWSTPTPYAHVVWDWFVQGMLRLHAGRLDEARPVLEQKFNMIDFMDKEMPRDPKSKVWSEWTYYLQCHTLRKEAEGKLRDSQMLPKRL